MSERRNSSAEDVKFRTSIGGQALIEGILMRGPKKQAIVVRTPEKLIVKEDELKFIKDKYPVLGWPIIRGVVAFLSSMINGVKALTFSAECQPEEEQEEPSKLDLWIQKHFSSETADKIIIGLAVVIGIVLAIGLFVLLPTVLTGIFNKVIESRLLKNLIEGVIRIIVFLIYMWLATKMKEIKRVWQYHGAEHKTIFCYEKQLPLTVENARMQSRFHPRCGTSFLFIVMIVSILVFAVVNWSNVWTRMVLRIVLLPVVVGISYEIIKWAGRNDNVCTRIVSAPGKALQRLTTQEPDDSMLEVAIEALRRVIPETEGEDLW
ncbi:MAG: DUF1385 domain-containing protein [Oscillospiraceae bacterium]|nr:DUF1385 domain-containing protein [Oscillospiraceae bacterium]